MLVGRLVANTEFLRALARHGSFERFLFLAGENADADAVHAALVAPGHLARERVAVHDLVNLPLLLAAGALDPGAVEEGVEAVRLAGDGAPLGALEAGLRAAFPAAPSWRARVAIAWAVKHGVLG